MAGEAADFSSYSYHAVKNFTTGEGGAATWNLPGVDDEALYKQYQLYSLHGQNKDALAKTKLGAWEYDIIGPWYKCNMTDIMAAIGLRQLDRYPGLLERRKEIIGKYDRMCEELGVFHLNHYGEDYTSSGHLYLVRILGIGTKQRNAIIEKLAERGVATNVHYKPLPMMTAYKAYGWDIKDFPNAYHYYHNLITLPLHTKLSDEDVEYVMETFKDVVWEYVYGKTAERFVG
jgi:dTDP-4-amino-4,6-dideoxygalactose transaminase